MRDLATQAAAGEPLVLVTNQKPYERVSTENGEVQYRRSAGGLVAALEPLMRQRGGLWVSWGTDCDEYVEIEDLPFRNVQVLLGDEERGGYYAGFANRFLWPLCHGFVERLRFSREEFFWYSHVNTRFAHTVAAQNLGRRPVWLHDYHLALCPARLRQLKAETPLALFWHIPFPSPEVFAVSPVARELLHGLLGADLLGFHREQDAENFLQTASALLGLSREGTQLCYEGRVVRVESHPIGVDATQLSRLASLPRTKRRAALLRRRLGAAQLLLGVDRLDYTKGIPTRLAAIEAVLEAYPSFRGRLVFVQLAVPSRTEIQEYQDLRQQIEGQVSRINGRFGTESYVPVRYLYQHVSEEELVALYLAADLALVTPFKDGMNLVAKEYVASRPDLGGALLLSTFAGAAEEMQDAYLINPYDLQSLVETILWALFDERSVRRRRMESLREKVFARDIYAWRDQFLESAFGSEGAESFDR